MSGPSHSVVLQREVLLRLAPQRQQGRGEAASAGVAPQQQHGARGGAGAGDQAEWWVRGRGSEWLVCQADWVKVEQEKSAPSPPHATSPAWVWPCLAWPRAGRLHQGEPSPRRTSHVRLASPGSPPVTKMAGGSIYFILSDRGIKCNKTFGFGWLSCGDG